MQTESSVSSIGERLRESVSLKMAVVGFLILILLIPVSMLRGLVEERSQLRETAAADIMRGWGGPQLVAGPVLMIPAKVVTNDSYSRRVTDTRLNVLPESLDIEVDLETQVLYRGIHEVPVYRAKARITGLLRVPDEQAGGPSLETLHRQNAFVALALTDAGTTRSMPVLRIGGREIPFEAGGALQDGWPPHMLARVGDIVAAAGPGARLPFEIGLDFTGGESLHVLPLGETTKVTMRSAWPSPSFTGRYLPHQREVGDDGFVAEWTLSGLGRPLPAIWLDGTLDASIGTASAVGVEMYSPVDLYQKTLRATRSLAEHTGFGMAYLLSAGASIVLIAGYSRSVLGAATGAGIMAVLLTGLYLFLYLVLQAEDYAMLAGALGLWIILASIMFLTRHVDWYRPRVPKNA